MLKQIIFCVMTLLLMTGCNEEMSYDYFMAHPKALKTAGEKCESNPQSDPKTCDIVARAVTDINQLLSDQQNDPEKFGRNLLAKETACGESPTKQDEQNPCVEAKRMLAVIALSPPE